MIGSLSKKNSVRRYSSSCSICGKRILNMGFDERNPIYKIMKSEGICYECAYWRDIIAHRPENFEVIDGKCYQFNPTPTWVQKTPFRMLGSDGKKFYIVRKDGTYARSNDVWFIADVPKDFRDQLPDTAWLTTARVYDRLERGVFACKSRACMDRYHCYRFDYRNEFTEDGPFNIPPKEWITGDEQCREFINLLDFKNYDEYVSVSDIIDDEKSFSIND